MNIDFGRKKSNFGINEFLFSLILKKNSQLCKILLKFDCYYKFLSTLNVCDALILMRLLLSLKKSYYFSPK